MPETATKRFISRKEIIAQVGIGAYNRAVESKRMHPYQLPAQSKNTKNNNCKIRVERNEYEEFLRSMRRQ